VLCVPDDLDVPALLDAVTRQWGVVVDSAEYRPLGFGSHHWTVRDPAGEGWFLTVDDLEMKRRGHEPTLDGGYDRLSGALATALLLHQHGEQFVVAPVPTAGGDPLARVSDRYAASLFPLVAGESFEWGDTPGTEHRQAVLDMLVQLHGSPPALRRHAEVDDLAVRKREYLELALTGGETPITGPYAQPVAQLIVEHAGLIRDRLDEYDHLVAAADRSQDVLTHGEPHPGNTMRTAGGWRLIDWDTVKVSLPERDLWLLGGDLTGYSAATGTPVRPEMLQLFELRWVLVDLALEVDRFRRPHTGSADDVQGWQILQKTVAGISA
jgi:spectinomycin phosphotransferase/16S rRNA (guanine(1405)-N(7))-methyltransferase